MKHSVGAVALPAALLLLIPAAVPREDPPLRGYTTASSKIQREWETKFRAIPDPARMREAMRRLTLRPHHLGSAYEHGAVGALIYSDPRDDGFGAGETYPGRPIPAQGRRAARQRAGHAVVSR